LQDIGWAGEVSGSVKDVLVNNIEAYVRAIAPGLIHTLNIYCRRTAGKECAKLFLEEPWTFRDILSNIYGSSSSAETIARMFIYPVKHDILIDEPMEKLIKLFFENPRELYRIIRKALESYEKGSSTNPF
jgi:hypothetical protein